MKCMIIKLPFLPSCLQLLQQRERCEKAREIKEPPSPVQVSNHLLHLLGVKDCLLGISERGLELCSKWCGSRKVDAAGRVLAHEVENKPTSCQGTEAILAFGIPWGGITWGSNLIPGVPSDDTLFPLMIPRVPPDDTLCSLWRYTVFPLTIHCW